MEQKKGCGCNKRNQNVNNESNVGPMIPHAPMNSVPGHPLRLQHAMIHAQPPKVQPESADAPVNQATQQPEPIQFKKREVINPETIKEQLGRKIGMVQSFATALASRGVNNNKINKPTKQLRVLSCFGNQHQGGQLPPCEYLRNSGTPGKHYCGGCGCGDKPHTWLMAQGEEYSKLDYPKLQCPLHMPGFSNYEPSKPEESTPPITRRFYIENIDYKEVDNISVSLPQKEEPPAPNSESSQ